MKEEILDNLLKANKNLIIEGDMSTGKTTNIIFPLMKKIIKQNENLIILDSKEEYINNFYENLKQNDYNIIVFNLRNLKKSFGFNPLEYGYNLYQKGQRDKASEYVNKIGKTLFYEKNIGDPFWQNEATNLFIGMVLGLYEDALDKEINFASINAILRGFVEKYGASNYSTEYFKSKDEDLKAYIMAAPTIFAPKDTMEGIISTVRQRLLFCTINQELNMVLNKTTFNYEDLLNKPTAIFMIGQDESKDINKLLAVLIINLFIFLIANQGKFKTNFILDNFDTIEYIDGFKQMLDSGINRNMKFIIATRSLDLILNTYDKYILKLCNLITLTGLNIKATINNETQEIRFEPTNLKLDNKKVDYEVPLLKMAQVFDLKKFMNNQKI